MKKMMKKILSAVLVAAMLVSVLSLSAFAEEVTEPQEALVQVNEASEPQIVENVEKQTLEDEKEVFPEEQQQESSVVENTGITSEEEPVVIGIEGDDPQYSIEYASHVQNIGWQDYVKDGEKSGTEGKCYRLESMKIKVYDISGGGHVLLDNAISYSVHVQNLGWINPVSDGEPAGTEGCALRLEAIKINLGSALSSEYDVFYRVHAQNYGTIGWAKNGEPAGTEGQALRLEQIEIKLCKKGSGETQDKKAYYTPTCKGMVTYQTHVQNIGWQNSVSDGAMAGTKGEAKRVEALKIWVDDLYDESGKLLSGTVEYRTHVQNIGWQDYVSEGELAGTSGQALRVEAIQIKLTGELADKYDVYYKVHIQNFGDLDWAKNDEVAGSAGYACRIESLEIRLCKKDDTSAPTAEGRSFLSSEHIGTLNYQSYIKGDGWQASASAKEISGTEGQSKALESIKVNVINSRTGLYTGSIKYSVNVASGASEGVWSDEVEDGAAAGAPDSGKMIQAIKISLTDELAKYCDVYYQVAVQDYGWLGWAKNGQVAGTTKCNYRLEAYKVVIIPKGMTAPGKNTGYYYEYKKGDIRALNMTMYNRVKNEASATDYLICVDCHENRIGIFSGSAGNWNLVKYILCTTGAGETPTIKGTFTISDKGEEFHGTVEGTNVNYSCWYWTRIYDNYLFHSILYKQNSKTEEVDGRLGMDLSHGCVRVSLENAKWIQDNIPVGTKVILY